MKAQALPKHFLYLFRKCNTVLMKTLFIPKIELSNEVSLHSVAELLENSTELQTIDVLNWKAFPYRPDIHFRIAHTGKDICLKYYVREKYIRAMETRTNGDVYKDSTVEFFISLDGKEYYNFEFSCIGTIHLSHGPGRGNRTRIDPKIAEKINIESSLGNQPFEERSGDFNWEMMIRIPVECFVFDSVKKLDGMKATANLYKCGDETSEPHFVTWNPIHTEKPDYHRIEFFGKIEFE